MQVIKSVYSSVFILVLISCLTISAVQADEGSCYLVATTDVYVEIYDLDRDGNDGDMLWSGRLNDGQKVRIKTPHARFRYKFNSEPDKKQALSVGPDKWCDSNNDVAVP